MRDDYLTEKRSLARSLTAQFLEQLLPLLPTAPGTALELGCGTGCGACYLGRYRTQSHRATEPHRTAASPSCEMHAVFVRRISQGGGGGA